MKEVLKIVNARKVLPLTLLLALTVAKTNNVQAQTWTKHDITRNSKDNKDAKRFTKLYRYMNVIKIIDQDSIVVQDLADKKERILKLNQNGVYLGERPFGYGLTGNSKFMLISKENVTKAFKVGDTIAVQVNTGCIKNFGSHSIKNIYNNREEIPVLWSEDPTEVITLFVPNKKRFLANRILPEIEKQR